MRESSHIVYRAVINSRCFAELLLHLLLLFQALGKQTSAEQVNVHVFTEVKTLLCV